jgi:hypothetical protein
LANRRTTQQTSHRRILTSPIQAANLPAPCPT